jgi:hypothetical protein
MRAQGLLASSLLGSEARLQDRHGGGYQAEHLGIYMICWTQGISSIVDKDSSPERLGALQVVWRVPSHGWPPPSRNLPHIATVPLLEAAREHRQCDKGSGWILEANEPRVMSLILCQAGCSMSGDLDSERCTRTFKAHGGPNQSQYGISACRPLEQTARAPRCSSLQKSLSGWRYFSVYQLGTAARLEPYFHQFVAVLALQHRERLHGAATSS